MFVSVGSLARTEHRALIAACHNVVLATGGVMQQTGGMCWLGIRMVADGKAAVVFNMDGHFNVAVCDYDAEDGIVDDDGERPPHSVRDFPEGAHVAEVAEYVDSLVAKEAK